MPIAPAAALSRLGDDLATARKRRRLSQRDWAKVMGISVPTLIRMERGDPAVSAGVYATALWRIGRAEALGEVADPQYDQQALERDVNAARRRYARTPNPPDDTSDPIDP